MLAATAACSAEDDTAGQVAENLATEDSGGSTTGSAGALSDSLGRTLGPISEEIVRLNADAERNLNLLLRLEVQRNELLEFYEPTLGTLMMTGAGAPDGATRVTMPETWNDMQAIESWWHELSEGESLPARLAEAFERRIEGQEAEGTEDQGETADQLPAEAAAMGSAPVFQAKDGVAEEGRGWCNSGYYTYDCPRGSPSWQDIGTCDCAYGPDECHCWTGTGTCWAQNSNCFMVRTNVCPYDGQVLFTVYADGPCGDGSWTVPENTVRWYRCWDADCDWNPFDDCPWVKSQVSQASGDAYHYKYYVDSG